MGRSPKLSAIPAFSEEPMIVGIHVSIIEIDQKRIRSGASSLDSRRRHRILIALVGVQDPLLNFFERFRTVHRTSLVVPSFGGLSHYSGFQPHSILLLFE